MFFDSSFFFFCGGGWGWMGEGQFDLPFIFQEDLIQYQYNFVLLLDNLFRVR